MKPSTPSGGIRSGSIPPGTKTRDQAIKDFKQDVADNLDVTVDLG